jgi:uncharacterized repeat protein (TIGR01451 family)
MFPRAIAAVLRLRSGPTFALLLLGSLGLAQPVAAQTFAPQTTITLNGFPGTVSPVRVRDGAGPLDIVVPTQAGVYVLLGSGSGTFAATAGSPLAANNFPESAAVGSINSATDSHADIAVANFNSGDISILLGDGTGAFGAATNVCAVPAPAVCGALSTNHAFSVAIARFNADAFPDLVVSNNGTNTVSVLLGNGDGTFGAPVTFNTGTGPEGLAVGDLNNDGFQDIVVTNYNAGQPAGGNNVSVLLGNGNGTFQAAVPYATQDGARFVAIADLGNGKPDLVVGTGNGYVSVLLGNGNGTFQAATNYLVGAGGLASFGVAVDDYNLDGKMDVAVANFNAVSVGPPVFQIAVLNGDGAGNLSTPGTFFTVGANPSYVGAGDFNGDGKPDLAVSNQGDGNLSILLNTVVPTADLSITKTKTSPTNVTAGQNVVYTTTVTNGGPNSAVLTTVADTTPAGLSFVSNTGACTTTFPCALGTLTPGQSKIITSTFLVAASYAGVSLDNTATATTSSTDPTLPNTSTATTPVVKSADLSITKTGPATVNAGQNVVYTITATNNGPSDAATVSVADTTPAGLTFVSNAGGCTTVFPCALGTLTPGQSKIITSTFNVPSGYSGASPIQNTATVSTTTTDPNGANNTSAVVSTTVGFSGDLSITKTGPATVNAGQNVVYTITVNSLGPSDAAAVVVSDTTPAGLTFVSNAGACTTAFPCSLGALASGQVRTITSTFLVPSGYAGASPIQNSATVGSGSTPDPIPANNTSATVSTTVGRSADLTISKTGPGTINAGQNIVYTITLTNTGPSDAAAVSVADTTPAGLTFVSNAGACTTAFPCALGTVTSGQVKTITSTYLVPSGYAGASPFSNTATATSTTADPTTPNTSTAATTVTRSADVSISKTGPGSAVLGANLVYTITVTNNGPSNAAVVAVADPTPAGLTFVSNAGACTTAFPCALGTMTAGQVQTITTTYFVPLAYAGANPILNTATVTTTTADPTPANNSSTASTGVGAASADLSITKVGPAQVFRGQPVVYTITVTNNGPTDAAGVTVADPTPTGLTFVSNTGDCVTAFPCTLGSVQSGASRTITATFDVPAAYAGPEPVVNAATVASSTADPDGTNNSASASARLDPSSLNTVTPCRLIDTRTVPNGPLAGPALVAGGTRNFTVTGTCNVPSSARAVSVNITVTQPTGAGDLQIYPAGQAAPGASSINYSAGQTRANNAVVPLGAGGAITVQVDQAAPGTVEFLLDVNAYFEP